MRFYFKIFLILFPVLNSIAQDKIYLRSKEVLNVRVIEVWPHAVFYTDPSDSTKNLIIKKRKIERIVYSNGSVYNTNLVDTIHYLKFGVIPYQIFGRSSGGYIGYSYKRTAIEYRYTFTLPTRFEKNLIDPRDLFFYRGHNHALVFSYRLKEGNSIGIQLGYRYWWYSNESIKNEAPFSSSYSIETIQSSKMSGLNYGIEYERDFSKNRFNGAFYINLSLTSFKDSYNRPRERVHLALGFKLGYRTKMGNKRNN